MKKVLYIMTLMSIIFINLNSRDIYASTYASSMTLLNSQNSSVNIEVSDEDISGYTNGIKITGVLPVVKSSNTTLNNKINNLVKSDYKKRVNAAKSTNTKSFEVKYQTYKYNDFFSIVVQSTATNLTEKTYADTYVVDSKGNLLDISDVLGGNGPKILTSYVNNTIENNNFGTGNVNITNSQDFYIYNGDVYLVFDSGVISSVHEGIYTIRIRPSTIRNKLITSSEYYVQAPFNVKMVKLVDTAKFFGYTVEKTTTTQYKLSKNGSVSTVNTSSLADNNYYKGSLPVNLEAKPSIKNDIVYVPVTFFSEVLDLVYYYENNSVTISSVN
ncbi:MAG: stalk domain-containing protein [Lachnospirales bacterium]